MEPSRLIADYEDLASLTREMHGAAEREEWDQLVALELRRSELVERMRASHVAVLLDEPGRRRKDEIITSVLDADREIRGRIEAWLGQLRENMQSNRQAQRLLKTYGA